MNLLVATLCLLCTAILCGAETTESSTEKSTDSVTSTTVSTSVSPPTESKTTGPPATDHTDATDTGVTIGNSTDTTTVDRPPPEPSSGGLSGGAIAGITIGTIAGVAVLGGGVYGLLKYTNKI